MHSLEQARAIAAQPIAAVPIADEDHDESGEDEVVEEDSVAAPEGDRGEEGRAEGEAEGRGRQRRRRGRRPSEGREASVAPDPGAGPSVVPADENVSAERLTAGEEPFERDGGPAEHGNGENRRRRRGRRGGRRNRRGRNGDGMRAPSDSAAALEAEPGAEVVPPNGEQPLERHEPEASPQGEARQARAPFERAQSAPPPPVATSQPEPPPVETAVPEPPRRRSTVREPAPVGVSAGSDAPMPVSSPRVETPQPVVSSDAGGESDDRPRRSGWWSRR
jgi:ribonuclease E